MKNSADVVVIGAGIQGISAAYHLAKLGVDDVVVVEKATVGSGSSRWSASMLMLQVWADWQVQFSRYCYNRYLNLEAEIGVSAGFKQTGTYTIVTPEVAQAERDLAKMRQRCGAKTDILTAEALYQRLPILSAGDLAFGVYGEADGSIDTPTILAGLREAAESMGVTILEGVPATGLGVNEGRVQSVITQDQTISTRFVVNAAGADAATVGEWAGLDIPIDNRVRNIFVVPHHPALEGMPAFVQNAADGWYFRQFDDGIMIGMGTRKDAPVQMKPDMDYWPFVQAAIANRVPALAEGPVIGGWSGIRPLTPDHRPILGSVQAVEGFINDCGWGGEGVMHAPIGGQLVAEVIANGKATTFDLEPFSLARFGN